MQNMEQPERQSIGCGFEPAIPDATPFAPCGRTTTICPGYSTRLPAVIEIARLRMHWDKGAVRYDDLEEHERRHIEVLEVACGDLLEWKMRPKSEGGGGS
jgi:hypothetical protein